MRIREYQLDKIDEARRIQRECLRLHLPCPPVLHWAYEIKEPDGEVLEIGRGKSNSYTRNALNILTATLGLAATNSFSVNYFTDGLLSLKRMNGAIGELTEVYIRRYAQHNAQVILSNDDTPESLDSYTYTTAWSSLRGTNGVISSWDSMNRKFITTISCPYVNNTGNPITIRSSLITLQLYINSLGSYTEFLLVRDVFDAISLEAGKTITWTYTAEVAYPNP